jgi:hypothetical protein
MNARRLKLLPTDKKSAILLLLPIRAKLLTDNPLLQNRAFVILKEPPMRTLPLIDIELPPRTKCLTDSELPMRTVSRTEKLPPKRAKPRTDRLLPNSLLATTLSWKQLPICIDPMQLTPLPILVSDLIDKHEDKVTKSSALMFFPARIDDLKLSALPRDAKLQELSCLPKRDTARRERELPMPTNSATERFPPKRAKFLIENDDPTASVSMTLTLDPILAKLLTDRADPKCTKESTLQLLPQRAKLRTETDDPIFTHVITLIL